MNFLNIDLKSDYERNADILDGYDLETLFLEISCNVTDKRGNCKKAILREPKL